MRTAQSCVASTTPVPVTVRVAPDPTTIAAVVFVPDVSAPNEDEPPEGVSQSAVVALVAVNTCPVVGGAALLTTTAAPVVASSVAWMTPVPVTTKDAPEP